MNFQTIPLYNLEGKEIEQVKLDKDVFDGEVNYLLLHQIKLMYEANLRGGRASTKRRGEVRGGGRKPWRQKGTGRARAGSSRSPLWRGGGVTFGPQPKDYHYRLPKKMIRAGLKNSLNMRLKEGAFRLIQEIELKEFKTRFFADILRKLKINPLTLIAILKKDANLNLASRNIAGITVKEACQVNAIDIINNSQLVLTKPSLKELVARIKK